VNHRMTVCPIFVAIASDRAPGAAFTGGTRYGAVVGFVPIAPSTRNIPSTQRGLNTPLQRLVTANVNFA